MKWRFFANYGKGNADQWLQISLDCTSIAHILSPVQKINRYSLILIAVLLGVALPIVLWRLGGIWRSVAFVAVATDITAVLMKNSGPIAFLLNQFRSTDENSQ